MTPATRPARKPRGRYHHGNLRRALIDEALATIRTDGVAGVTLREIGARLGVSRTALYRHFSDKRALLTAVATEGFRTLRQQLVAAWEDGGRTRPAFEAMGIAYVEFAVANPAHYRVMFGGFVDPIDQVDPDTCPPELAEESAGAFQALVDALAAMQHAGLVHRENTLLMARFVWSTVHGVAMLAIDGQLPEPGAIDALTRYTVKRLGTGLDAESRRASRKRS